MKWLVLVLSMAFAKEGVRLPPERIRPVEVQTPQIDIEEDDTEATVGGGPVCVDCEERPRPRPTEPVATTANQLSCPSNDRQICDMFSQVNRVRRQNGLPAYRYDATCERAAKVHGNDMASRGFFSHTGSDGSSHDQRYRRVNGGRMVRGVGENIYTASYNADAAAAMNTFMNSPGHRANILSYNFSHIGLARTTGRCGGLSGWGSCTYYVQCFSNL